jgi:uncharacterized protein YqjF (DUF2071 family)
MRMSWHDLLFAHWPVPAELLRPHVPAALPLDTFDGAAWIGVVPFRMTGVTGRWLPPIPGFSSFPESNVRTYVNCQGKPGVWFFALDAASSLAVWGARTFFELPYFRADMQVTAAAGRIAYSTRRRSDGGTLRAEYWPTGEVFQARPGSLDHWLTERYCLYAAIGDGRLRRLDIHHLPWPLQPAAATIAENSVARVAGVPLPDREPVLHFAGRLDMVGWLPEPVVGGCGGRP